MKSTVLYRIASILFVIFAVTHTAGLLGLQPPTPEAAVVRNSMNEVHFQEMGSTCTYGGFFVGYGLFLTVYLLFSAFLAWHLGGLARTNPKSIGVLSWMFFAVELTSVLLSWRFFFGAPIVMSASIAV